MRAGACGGIVALAMVGVTREESLVDMPGFDVFAGFVKNESLLYVAAAAEIALLAEYRRRFKGTTLCGAWWWAVAATLALTVVEICVALRDLHDLASVESLRFLVGALTFCPLMAVLGARRPHHRAWHFVVFSMWGVVALPALENLVLHRGQFLAIHGVRSLFLAGLVVVGVANWLPTPLAPAAMLFGLGQVLWFAPHLPLLEDWRSGNRYALAFVCFVAATALARMIETSTQRTRKPGYDCLWRDFRDRFGVLWAVRVMDRVNAAAVSNQWTFRLTWSGFQEREGKSLDEEPLLASRVGPTLDTVIDNLLRRFVTPDWIAKRRGRPVH